MDIIKKAVISSWLFLPQLASAAIITDPAGEPIKTAAEIEAFIINIQNILFGIAGAIAVAMIIWGGVMLMTSGGNEEKTGKGKKILTYAIGGLLFIIFSYAIVTIYIRMLGGTA